MGDPHRQWSSTTPSPATFASTPQRASSNAGAATCTPSIRRSTKAASRSSFVWADQSARFGQLSAALEVARRVPVDRIDRAEAVAWLETELAEPRPGAATVVFHSVVLPYLTEDGRSAIGRILSDAGARATADAPLAWLSMEPGKVQAEVHLTVWPGGERRLIAESTFHGRDVKVL